MSFCSFIKGIPPNIKFGILRFVIINSVFVLFCFLKLCVFRSLAGTRTGSSNSPAGKGYCSLFPLFPRIWSCLHESQHGIPWTKKQQQKHRSLRRSCHTPFLISSRSKFAFLFVGMFSEAVNNLSRESQITSLQNSYFFNAF